MNPRWPVVPLGAVVSNRKMFINIDDSVEYKRCRVQLYAKGVVLRDVLPGAAIKTKKQQVCRAGEFLVAEIDAKVGGFGIVPEELDGAIVSSHYFLFGIDRTRLERGFLEYYIRTPAFREQVGARGSTNYAAIRPAQVLAYQIPLPPLAEQRHIVAKIDQLAAKIDEARGLRLSTTKGLARLPERHTSNLLKNLGGRTQSLGSIATARGGGTPSKSNPLLWEGKIPWISPKDMKKREIADAVDHISEEATRCSTARLLNPGAVLIVVRGMILVHTVPAAVLRVPGTINQDMKALVPSSDVLSEYLCAAIWGFNDELLKLVEKSTHDTRKLETPTLLAFKIPVPPLTEQRRIVAYLDDLQSQVDRLKELQAATAAELDALLPSILDRAFKGEL